MADPLAPVIQATAHALLRAFPAPRGALNQALAEAQARQAATVAARLRFPTEVDRALLALLGPQGAGPDPWEDATVTGWAAALLADPELARAAAEAAGLPADAHRRLSQPSTTDHAATPLLRHPDLLDSLARVHRDQLHALLCYPGPATALAAPTP